MFIVPHSLLMAALNFLSSWHKRKSLKTVMSQKDCTCVFPFWKHQVHIFVSVLLYNDLSKEYFESKVLRWWSWDVYNLQDVRLILCVWDGFIIVIGKYSCVDRQFLRRFGFDSPSYMGHLCKYWYIFLWHSLFLICECFFFSEVRWMFLSDMFKCIYNLKSLSWVHLQ